MLTRSANVEAADWLVSRLHPFAQDVGSYVPDMFAAYVRLLHPARCAGRRPMSWAQLARDADVTLLATTPYEDIAPSVGSKIEAPEVGTLDGCDLRILVSLLATFTETPERCWFGWWAGFSALPGCAGLSGNTYDWSAQRQAESRAAWTASQGPYVEVHDRSLVLFYGPIAEAARFSYGSDVQSPTLWWPDDRRWCVASEIDFHSTYIGGSQGLIDSFLSHENVEGMSALITDRVFD